MVPREAPRDRRGPPGGERIAARKRDIVFAWSPDHHTQDGSLQEVLDSRPHVWAFGVVVHRDSERIIIAMGGATFGDEPIEEQDNISHFTIRAPYKYRKVGSVRL